MTDYEEKILNEKQLIIEMMSAAIELSEKLGKHPMTAGCNCAACIDKRKRAIRKPVQEWRFRL